MSDYLDPNNEELLKDFFAEAEMQVSSLEQNILVLEQDINNSDAIDEIFRAAHTLKGAAATVQMTELAEFMHIAEDVLDDIRSHKIKVDGNTTDLLLECIDVIKEMLAAKADGTVYHGEVEGIKARLQAMIAAPGAAPKARPAAVPSAPKAAPVTKAAASSASGLSEYEVLELRDAADGSPVYHVRVRFDESNPMNSVGGIQVFAALKDVGRVLKTVPEFDKLYEDTFFPEVQYFLASSAELSTIEARVSIRDVTLGADVFVLTGKDSTEEVEIAAVKPSPRVAQAQAESKVISEVQRDLTVHETQVQREIETANPEGPVKEGDKKQHSGGSILRVESRRIDELLNLVSETVINKATFNQVSNLFSDMLGNFQNTQNEYRKLIKELFDALPEYLERIQRGATVKDIKKEISDKFSVLGTMFDPLFGSLKSTVAKFRSTAQNLGRITSELQEGVMRIRMVPISQIFSRFPRLVRDLGKQLNKDVNLTIEGEETELDKSVIEDLLDPLIHCVRNAIDHGVEAPDARRKAGKPEKGEVLLKASNEGNMILIEISDDGRGIDVDAVRKKAVERGIIHPNKALTDVEAFNMIFDAGFSTAQSITNISGRGVGLDVVKRQIEKLNGSVSVQSEKGKGTHFIIKIPLTLAIIQGLLVRVGSETYAIPITAVLDSHRIKPSEIRLIDNYEVFNVRDDVVSLMRLSRLFKIQSDEQKEYYFVVIVGSGDKKMGLIVDTLIGEEDVVIKPLRDHYTNAPGIAGANITGDGTVSLIIDVSQLLELGQKKEIEARRLRETSLN